MGSLVRTVRSVVLRLSLQAVAAVALSTAVLIAPALAAGPHLKLI